MNRKLFLWLSLLGAMFLTHSASAWRVHATFDNGTLGTKAEKASDAFVGAAGQSLYTDEQKLVGNAVKLQAKKGDTGYGNWGGEFSYPKTYKGETIWYLVHTYMPLEFDNHAYGEGNRLKFLRIHTQRANGTHIGYNDVLFDMKSQPNPFIFGYEGENNWKLIGGAADFPVKDTWESYELAVTLDRVTVDQGGKARIRFWRNGILIADITDRRTLEYDDANSTRALLFTYWNGGAPKDQHMYADEIIITNETPSNTDAHGNRYLGGLISKRPVMDAD